MIAKGANSLLRSTGFTINCRCTFGSRFCILSISCWCHGDILLREIGSSKNLRSCDFYENQNSGLGMGNNHAEAKAMTNFSPNFFGRF